MSEDDIDALGLFLEHDGFTNDEIDRYFLEHTGVRGMKWGVRRNKAHEKRSRSRSEKAGIAFTAAFLAAMGTFTLAAIKM